jgi:glutamyl-Q tRNA(Asp) synthetase
VVVDDAFQGITRVVRGADLLPSTPWQIDLQQALSLSRPIYGHLPLLLEPDGAKLSKSRRSLPLDPKAAPHALFSTLTHLSQTPPPDLAHSSIKEVWKWAIRHWNPRALAGNTDVRLSA